MSDSKDFIIRRDFKVGERSSISKTISEKDIESFASITLDYNPVHMDNNFAANTRFKGRIAHGMLVAGLISAVLGTKLPGPGCIYINQNLNFLAPVKIDDRITTEVEVKKWNPEKRIINLYTKCINQNGEVVLEGEALLLHKPPEE